MAARRPARWLWTPVLAYMAFIFALSSVSEPPRLPEGSDKNLHALLYAGLGALLVRAWAGGLVGRRIRGTAVVAAVTMAALYGVSDEFHQWFVPPRAVEAGDVAADTIGAAVAALALYAWSWLVTRRGI